MNAKTDLQGHEDEHQAFGQFWASYYDRLVAYGRRRRLSIEDAEECAATALFNTWRRGPKVENIWAYLCTVCRNEAIGRLGSRQRKHEVLPRIPLGDARSLDVPIDGFEDALHRQHEDITRLERAREFIEGLPETLREAIRMHAVEGLDYTEIGKRLGVTDNAIKIRVCRARKELNALLEGATRKA